MFVTEILDTWAESEKNVYKMLKNMGFKELESISYAEEYEEAKERISNSHIYHFKKIFELAKEKFVLWKKRNRTYKIESFIRYCKEYRPGQSEGLGLKYYANNGGYIRSSHFLFGIASQFR